MFCDLRYGTQGRFVFRDRFQGRPLTPFQNRPARFSNPGSTSRFLNVVHQAKGIRRGERIGLEAQHQVHCDQHFAEVNLAEVNLAVSFQGCAVEG
jgi:hypothetical protein